MQPGDGPIRLSDREGDYVVVDIGGTQVGLHRMRARRTARWLLKWAAIRAVACASVGVATGEYSIAFAAWAALTIFHIDRHNERY